MTFMTLNTKIEVFVDFLVIFGCETFEKRIAPKSLEIDKDKLHMKFPALNAYFSGPSLDLLVQGNLHMRASNSGTP